MDEDAFWALIDQLDWSREGDDESVVEPVVDALAERSVEDIRAFHRILSEKLYAIDGRAWAREAGDMIWWGEPDQLSVDGFLYARCAVVANGRGFYESVRHDPSLFPTDLEFESLLYVAETAYRRKVGLPSAELGNTGGPSFETFTNASGWQ